MSLSNSKKRLEEIIEKIEELDLNWRSSYCPVQKKYFQQKLIEKIYEATYMIDNLAEELKFMEADKNIREDKVFTLEELKNFDGTNGKPAYVAVDGVVYDVSLVAAWGGASHFGLLAGNDLTKQFNECHLDKTTLSKLPIVGTLIK